MAIKYATNKSTTSAKLKVGLSGLVGILIFLWAGNLWSWRVAPLVAWDVAAFLYAAWIWMTIWKLNGELTAQHAVREDPSRAASDAVVICASIASLAAVGLVLVEASNASGAAKVWQIAFSVASVVLGWIVVHTLFALRYAELYYKSTPGGVKFDGASQPSYKDFAYLAFTLGMTFQVSDTDFQSTEFRTTALRHALLSYVFGTVIVATTINLIAGLTK